MTIFVLSILFLLSRILHLLFCFPNYYIEDLFLGILPKELIEGLKIPFFDYAATHYHGGTLVYGVLTVPFFLLFGKSAFALRLTAILFQLGAFVTWHLFLKRFFGKTPALYASLLYLFSPPWLTLFSMFANGSHTESLFFTAAGLFLLYRILYEKSHPVRDSLLLGLVCGFGSYFTYGILVSTLSFLLFWVYEDRKIFKRKELYLFCLFFVIGFSPWVVYNMLYQFHGVDRIREALAYPDGGKVLILPLRFLKLATLKVIGSFSFNYRQEGHYNPHITLLNFIYYAAVLFSYILLYRVEGKNRKTHFLFLFPLLYLGAASVSRFGMDTYFNMYFLPLFPFFFAVIALGLTRLGSFSRGLQKVSVLVVVLLLMMGLKGELNLLSLREYKLSLRYRGYSYYGLGWALVDRHGDNPEQLIPLGKKLEAHLSPSEWLGLYRGFSELFYRMEDFEESLKYLPWMKAFDKTYSPLFLTEMGRIVGPKEELVSKRIDYVTKYLDREDQPYLIQGFVGFFDPQLKADRLLENALGEIQRLSPQNQRALAYGLGWRSWERSFDVAFLDKINRRRELERLFPPKLLPLYYRGVGALMTDSYDPSIGKWPFSFRRALQTIDRSHQEAIYWGAGFEAPLLYEDPFEYERMEEGVPALYRGLFRQGIQDRLEWGGHNYWMEGTSRIARSRP